MPLTSKQIDVIAKAIRDADTGPNNLYENLLDADKEPYRQNVTNALKAIDGLGLVLFEKDSVEASVGLMESVCTMWGLHPMEDIAEEAWKSAVHHGAIELNQS
jgi:hypothetical protein